MQKCRVFVNSNLSIMLLLFKKAKPKFMTTYEVTAIRHGQNIAMWTNLRFPLSLNDICRCYRLSIVEILNSLNLIVHKLFKIRNYHFLNFGFELEPTHMSRCKVLFLVWCHLFSSFLFD